MLDLVTYQGYEGVTGEMIFDSSWNDIGDIWMVEIKRGNFDYFPRPPFKSERAQSSTKAVIEK